MTDVTYVRITSASGTTLTGDNGATWIPVSDAQIGVAEGSSGPSANLAFTLANDDSIANKLDVALDAGGNPQIEVATYDTSTATSTSVGTLVSYAIGTASLTNDTVTGGTHAFSASLQSLSTTTYPSGQGGSADAFAEHIQPVRAAQPTSVPSDVASGAIVSSINPNPSPSDLTYYARFETSQGSYITNAAGGTWFAIGTPTGGPTQGLDISLRDSAAVPTLFDDLLSGTPLTAVQVEGLSGSSIIDNTTYETAQPQVYGNQGTFQFEYASFYAQHTASGGLTSSIGYDEATSKPDTGANAIAAALPGKLGTPSTSSLYFALNGVTGDTTFPAASVYTGETDTSIFGDDQPIIGTINTGFAISGVSYTDSYIGNVGGEPQSRLSSFEISSPDANLALIEDNRLLSNTSGYSYIVHAQAKSDPETENLNAEAHLDQIDLTSGQHNYSFTVASDGVGSSAMPGPFGPAYDPPYTEGLPPAPTAADPAAGMTYVQFRDASGTVVTSASGQDWFSASSAQATLSGAFNTNFVYSTSADLSLTLGSDAPSAALDADIVAGEPLTAEVAVYNGAGTQLQADYVYSDASLNSHVNDAASGNQTLALSQGSFQETYYASGQATGSLSYNAATNTTSTTATQPIYAPQTVPTGSATPSTPETYVQFIGTNGLAIAGSNGQTWFQVNEAGSELAAQPGSSPILGAFGVDIGDDAITASLDQAALTGSGVATIDVASFGDNHSLQSYQRYTGTTIDTASVDNTGDDHQYSFDYTGYGESMPGPYPLFDPPATASAGSGASIPTLDDQATATLATTTATMAPSLSTLSFYAELKQGSEVFQGTSSGFVPIDDVSVDLLQDTATFSVSAAQAPGLIKSVVTGAGGRLEIAGYDSSGRSVDYVLIDPALSASTSDAASGLDDVTLGYRYIQTTSNGTTTTTNPSGAYPVDAPQSSAPAVCFVSGTRIATTRGNVAVEDLRVGDLAITASGATRLVVWIGDRDTDCRDTSLRPVRIAARAFGEALPTRDLYLSPGHPVLVGADTDNEGGHLVPIMCLVNGTTIERVAVDEVTYWHVELDEHDILLAEGLPAESYIDLGSRPWFAGADGALYDPDMTLPGIPGRCRPVAIDGLVVEVERRRLDLVFATQLADACAWPTGDAPTVGWDVNGFYP